MLPSTLENETGILVDRYVSYSEKHLQFDEDTPFWAWQQVFETLLAIERGVRWWLGDAIRFGERKYGETYAHAIAVTGYSYQTLANSVWVATRYPQISDRQENLPFGHYEAAASLPDDARVDVLQRAREEEWTQRTLREEIRALKEAQDTEGETVTVVRTIPCPHCNGTGELVVAE